MGTRVNSLLFGILRTFKNIKGLLYRYLHKIPGFRFVAGKGQRLYDYLYDIIKPKGIIIVSAEDNRMYVDTRDKGMVPLLLLNGTIEPYSVELFKQRIREGMNIVDIGANIGYFSLIAARLTGKGGRVYAFEPQPDSYNLLRENIQLNGYTNIIPIQKAVSDKTGKIKLWYDNVNFASPSFSKDNVAYFQEKKCVENCCFCEVEIVTLDEYINQPVDILKIDAEGAEGLIINGARRLMRNDRLTIIMEFWPFALKNMGTNPGELLRTIREFGFTISFINEKHCRLDPVQDIDSFCGNKDNISEGFNVLIEKR